MRGRLLATTALVAAGFIANADGAAAQGRPVAVMVGGFHGQFVGYVDQDNGAPDPSGDSVRFDQQNESEIFFIGRGALDNGITLGFRVELEASSQGDQIDESFLFIEGSFGRIELGSLDNVAYRMHYRAPDVFTRGWFSDNRFHDWVRNPTGSSSFDSTLGTAKLRFFDNDSEKINYYTPRFSGFQLGLSYIPEASQDRNEPVPLARTYNRGFAAGANYVREFGALSIAASLGYLTWSAPEDANAPDPDGYSAGLVIGYGGFRIGGSFVRIDNGRAIAAGTATTAPTFPNANRVEGTAYEVGASYAWGPLGVSLTYFDGRNDDSPVAGPDRGDDRLTGLALSGNYKLGPGINLDAVLFHSKFRGNTAGTDEDDNEASGFVTGIVLVF